MFSANAFASFTCGVPLLFFIPYLEEFSFYVPSLLFLLLSFMLAVDVVVVVVLIFIVKFQIVE